MKKFRIEYTFDGSGEALVKAKSEEEAREKFYEGTDVDWPNREDETNENIEICEVHVEPEPNEECYICKLPKKMYDPNVKPRSYACGNRRCPNFRGGYPTDYNGLKDKCPDCRTRLQRMFKSNGKITQRLICPGCNVEWAIGEVK